MKISLLIPTLFVLLTIQVNAQFNRTLSNKVLHEDLQFYLEEIEQRYRDTTYLMSAIPDDPYGIPGYVLNEQNFPYPVIFIHGLTGSSETWQEIYTYALQQGWNYGSTLRYNLNSDDDLSYCNIFSANPIDVANFNTNIPVGDFYILNFNCSLTGVGFGSSFNHPSQSNQAAIVKQAFALRSAIGQVLQATGKEKVILFCHSMGGLAARHYLQTTSFWQPDNKHHVAKLITSGTPHGGSNLTGGALTQVFSSLNERSDAVRDLRRNYFYSNSNGVFLYGGQESSTVMFDNLLGFYNYDVNCNGVIGNNITGLNQKTLPRNLDFSCIIGNVVNNSDLVVGTTFAQIKSFYDVSSETFTINTGHTSLPGAMRSNFEALDEPDEYDLAYEIEMNKVYNGYITQQAPDAAYTTDFDDYIFTITQPGWVSIDVDNPLSTIGVSILKADNLDFLYDEIFQTDSISSENIFLPAGQYYLEIFGTGSSITWQDPYYFRVNWSSSPPSSTQDRSHPGIELDIAPNPVADVALLRISLDDVMKTQVSITNELGQAVFGKTYFTDKVEESIDFSSFPRGLYFVTVQNNQGQSAIKLLLQ
jgi:triacylglycerol esterase/lipase EstA (alpha/beta hydrolase family)